MKNLVWPYARLISLIVLVFISRANAQTNGTWINATSNSTWGSTSNWSGGVIADGADGIADFSTLDIAANRTVNLGANRTIGTIIVGDATTASNTWAIANGSGGPWTLTLATSVSVPVIQVVNQTVTISAVLGGSQGLSKTGAGALTLSNVANTLTGGIALSGGALNFANGALGANLVTFASNSTLGWSAGNTQDLSAQLKIEDGVTAIIVTGCEQCDLRFRLTDRAERHGRSHQDRCRSAYPLCCEYLPRNDSGERWTHRSHGWR